MLIKNLNIKKVYNKIVLKNLSHKLKMKIK